MTEIEPSLDCMWLPSVDLVIVYRAIGACINDSEYIVLFGSLGVQYLIACLAIGRLLDISTEVDIRPFGIS